MSDNCECEYCSNQGEVNDCWALKEIAALRAKVAELTSANSSMVAICAYHKPGWSCPFHAGDFCDSNGCNEAPRIQRQ